jgi:hypothetical protein
MVAGSKENPEKAKRSVESFGKFKRLSRSHIRGMWRRGERAG